MANQRKQDTNPRPDTGTTRPLEKPGNGNGDGEGRDRS